MANPQFNSKSPTIRRILKEAAEISSSPSPDYTAAPLETDLFEWHFTLRGPPGSAFAGGIYHGRIVLPPTYPLRPPSFRFATPSGRFEANREICLSISGHHEETWQPAWGVRTALVALRSFMETDARGQLGGLDAPDAVRRRLAAESPAWRCPACARSNAEIIAECEERSRRADADAAAAARRDVQVPAELQMGFRDEMEKAKKKKKAAGEEAGAGDGNEKREAADGEDDDDDSESAQLAEGFVQTVPERDVPPPPPAPASAARPAKGVPVPTAAGAAAATGWAASRTAQRTQPADPNEGVPAWVDYAIVSLVVVLIAMLTKILLAG
ncbi:UBC-like protein [Durotheca rogersii]|uniref:UBC-like protein n=1 Tax=Durotheca rogersii TaxID=419775 RepID=UPI002220E281|nr:UBC-like protein [Durotheca rogersii]KAI5867239.1 UBC-like protein [Durotheca rogersii]